MSPALLGALRALAVVVLIAVLSWLGNATNLQGILNPETASIVAMVALALEHSVEGRTGNALFGAATVRRS